MIYILLLLLLLLFIIIIALQHELANGEQVNGVHG